MKYQLFHEGFQLAHVKSRIDELERRHLEISLRMRSPTGYSPFIHEDEANLAKLEASLAAIREEESRLLSNQQPKEG